MTDWNTIYQFVVRFFKKPREDDDHGDAWVEFDEPHVFVDPECGHVYVRED